jgi:hypothetical protein
MELNTPTILSKRVHFFMQHYSDITDSLLLIESEGCIL